MGFTTKDAYKVFLELVLIESMCLVAEGASLGIRATIFPAEDGEPATIISEARWTSNKRGLAYNNASYRSLFGGFGSELTWAIFINWRMAFLLLFAKTI